MRKLAITLGLLALALNTQAIQSPEPPTSLTLEIGWMQHIPANEPFWNWENFYSRWFIGNEDQTPVVGAGGNSYFYMLFDNVESLSTTGGGWYNHPEVETGFTITFTDGYDRLAKNAIIDVAGNGTYEIVEYVDPWGTYYDSITFTWGTPAAVGVPDAGSTAGLLGLALGGLAWAGRRSVKKLA